MGNILLSKDNVFWFIDWQESGFFPSLVGWSYDRSFFGPFSLMALFHSIHGGFHKDLYTLLGPILHRCSQVQILMPGYHHAFLPPSSCITPYRSQL